MIKLRNLVIPKTVIIASCVALCFVLFVVVWTKWDMVRFKRSLASENSPTGVMMSKKTPAISEETGVLTTDNSDDPSVPESPVFNGEGKYAGMTADEILADIDRHLETFHAEHSEWKERQAEALLVQRRLDARLAEVSAELDAVRERDARSPKPLLGEEFLAEIDAKYPRNAAARKLLREGNPSDEDLILARVPNYPFPPKDD